MPGDTWTVSGCKQCICFSSSTTDCQPLQCENELNCQSNERPYYYKPEALCCGYCEPLTCLFNYTQYKIGDVVKDPVNPCVTYTCTESGMKTDVQICPKQDFCAQKLRTYDAIGCCYTCDKSCQVSAVGVKVTYITTTERFSGTVSMNKCIGSCNATVSYNTKLNRIQTNATGCVQTVYENRTLVLHSEINPTKTFNYIYRHNTNCSCVACPAPPQ